MLIHVQRCGSQLREHKQKLQKVYLMSWYNCIFDYKLNKHQEQLRLKIIKKLRTTSLISELTGSYNKKVYYNSRDRAAQNIELNEYCHFNYHLAYCSSYVFSRILWFILV